MWRSPCGIRFTRRSSPLFASCRRWLLTARFNVDLLFLVPSLLYNVWKLVYLFLLEVLNVDGDGPVVSFMAVAGAVRQETGIG